MTKCLNCGEPIEQKRGKRKRLYCNDLCRLRDWQRKNKRHATKKTAIPIKPPEQKATNPPQELSLLEQLRAVESEKLPDYVKSEQGRVYWQQAQRKKINNLKNKIKSQ